MWRTENEFYAIGTGAEEARGEVPSSERPSVFPLLRSADLIEWHACGHAMRRPDAKLGSSFWAPEIAYAEGIWYLYYSVGHSDRFHQLRVATASQALGPYNDCSQLTKPSEVAFAIDPHPFRDQNGRWYLFHARDFLDADRDARAGTALVVAELETMTRLSADVRTVLRAHCDWQLYAAQRTMYGRIFDWHTLEGPCVVREGARYYCLYSGGCWHGDTYGVDYTASDDVLGPYDEVTDIAGPRLLHTVAGALIGPGHCSVFETSDGTRMIAYHAWDAAMTARRMYVERLSFDSAGPRPPLSMARERDGRA